MKNPTESNYKENKLYSSNDIIITITLGILWGLIEVFLSPYLSTFRLPLTGVILSAIAIIIMLTGRNFAPSPGTILFMGITAALIKFFSQTSSICYPSIAIIVEALIAEIIILIFRIRFMSFLTTGVLLLIYVSLHSIFSKSLAISQWKNLSDAPLFNRIAHTLDIDSSLIPWIIFSFFIVHVLVGMAAALLSWNLIKFLSINTKSNQSINNGEHYAFKKF